MTTLHVIYDIDGWAYHSRAQAIARHAPADFEVRLASYDPLTTTSIPMSGGPWRQADGQRHEFPVGEAVQPTTELAEVLQGTCCEA